MFKQRYILLTQLHNWSTKDLLVETVALYCIDTSKYIIFAEGKMSLCCVITLSFSEYICILHVLQDGYFSLRNYSLARNDIGNQKIWQLIKDGAVIGNSNDTSATCPTNTTNK